MVGPLRITYTGQVHTLDRRCSTRWQEEDSGQDGTGLVNRLRLRLAAARGVKPADVQWFNK
jgi:hypothetical protein